MAIYREPFGIMLDMEYQINEETQLETYEVNSEVAITRHYNQIPLFTEEDGVPTTETTKKHYGGKFDWRLTQYQGYDEVRPEIKVQLMRLWNVQMIQQLVTNKSYVNEIDSKIGVNISKDDLNTTLKVLDVVSSSIHREMDSINNSMITKRKMAPFKMVGEDET